jgi:hypothetical protein
MPPFPSNYVAIGTLDVKRNISKMLHIGRISREKNYMEFPLFKN